MSFSPISNLNKNCFNLSYAGYAPGLSSNPLFFRRAFTAVEIGDDSAIYMGTFGGEWQAKSWDVGAVLTKLLSTGNPDMGYMNNQGTGFVFLQSGRNVAQINKILIEPDNSSIIGGGFNTFNSSNSYNLVKLKRDGTKDSTFFSTGLPTGTTVSDIKKQSDGKYIICGAFPTYSGASRNSICRINSDGTLDTTFNVGTGFSAVYVLLVYSIALQSDGKIIAVGRFQSYNGTNVYQICRLNTDGTLDNTFTTSTDTDVFSYISKVIVLPDDKILICGNFKTYLGNLAPGFAKLNSNGTFFGTYTGYTSFFSNDSISTIALQSDGKIILGPWIYQNLPILRLNSDLTLDANFTRQVFPSINVNGPTIYQIGLSQELLQDIYIVGEFMSISGSTYSKSSSYIAKLGPNGELRNCIYDPPLNIEYKTISNFINSPSTQYDERVRFTLTNGATCYVFDKFNIPISGTTTKIDYSDLYKEQFECNQRKINAATNISFVARYNAGATGSYTFTINGNTISTNTFSTTGTEQTLFTYPYSSISNGQRWELITNITYP